VITRLARAAAAEPLFALLVAVNLGLSLPIAIRMFTEPVRGNDWLVLVEAGRDVMAGINPYGGADPDSFRWSPLLAYLFWALQPIGFWGWTVLTMAPILLLRDARLILLFASAWPLWHDVVTGVSFLFVPLAAVLAVRGSTAAAYVYAALTFLIPRPLMLPVLAWLLWHRPELRLPTLAIGVVLTAGAFLTGWTDEWISTLLFLGSEPTEFRINLLAVMGPAWIVMVALAVWLTVKGRLGLASIAIAPYWLMSYALMLILEFRDPHRQTGAHEPD
jgi:hypothetical protein